MSGSVLHRGPAVCTISTLQWPKYVQYESPILCLCVCVCVCVCACVRDRERERMIVGTFSLSHFYQIQVCGELALQEAMNLS